MSGGVREGVHDRSGETPEPPVGAHAAGALWPVADAGLWDCHGFPVALSDPVAFYRVYLLIYLAVLALAGVLGWAGWTALT